MAHEVSPISNAIKAIANPPLQIITVEGHAQTSDGRHSNQFILCFHHNIDGGISLPSCGGFIFPTAFSIITTFITVDGRRFHIFHDRETDNNPTGECRLIMLLMSNDDNRRRMYRDLRPEDAPYVDRAFTMYISI